MKLKATLLFLLFFLIQTSHAQVFQNGVPGYETSYIMGNPSSSCLLNFAPNNGGLAFRGGYLDTMTLLQDGLLKITSFPTISNDDPSQASPAYLDLYFVDGPSCSAMSRTEASAGISYYVNMSGLNSRVKIRARSDKPADVKIYLAYSLGGSYPNESSFDENIFKTISLTTTMSTHEIDFSNWADRSKVNLIGFAIQEPDVEIYIEQLSVGAIGWGGYANHLKGNIYNDVNHDCNKQSGENGLSGMMVEASDGQNSYWNVTDENGDYVIAVDSGTVTYAVTPHIRSKQATLYSNECVPAKLVQASGSAQDFCCTDFGVKVVSCALLSVELNSDRRRRCFRSNTTVTYSNYGTSSSSAAVVKVVYPEYVKPISSVPNWSSKVGDTLIYELGSLAAGSRGYILLIDSVICGNETIRGLAQCTKAFISPKAQCLSNEPAWDGSSVTVFPYCENGVARFVVQNVGLEDMASSSAYRLYSNDTLVFQSTFQLISGNTFQVRYPANGAVIRLEADQRPSHPGRSQPRAFVEGCGTAAAQTSVASESLVLSVPQDDLDEEVAISCLTIIDSYDPNDKAALPVGMTDDHLVKAGTPLKYTIRFQNTGSDVAYKVVVVDTLDLNLDVATFTENPASHPYVLTVSSEEEKTVLTYTFNNINLKDSTTSEPESHGFLSFYINAKADLADGNTIHNKADIFFDYNSAIVTNVVDHTIGTYVPTDLTKGNKVQVSTGLFDEQANETQRVTLYPNPASDVVQVKLDQSFNSGQLIILDLSGHEVWSGALKGEITSVSLSILPAGMYLYKVQCNGEYVGVGKLVVK